MRVLLFLLLGAGLYAQTTCVNCGGGASGGSSAVTPTPPYLSINGVKCIAATMFPATLPNFTGYTFLTATSAIKTTGTNGNVILDNSANSGPAWYSNAAVTSSVEAVFTGLATGGDFFSGPFLWDQTNGQIYVLQLFAPNSGGNGFGVQMLFRSYTYNGITLGPPVNILLTDPIIMWSIPHLKMAATGTALKASFSLDGGGSYVQVGATQSVGTIGAGGLELSAFALLNVQSLSVQ
jgi:hypothetical protein